MRSTPHRLLPLLVAASVLWVAPAADAGRPGAARARRPAPASASERPTYLSPVTRGRRLVGFSRSTSRPRGVRARLGDAARVTFGKLPRAAALRETTLWIPGHTLGWRSLRPAMKHFLGNRKNGEVAAVYVAREGRFRANSPRGRVLSDAEVRATRL
ncbi:MAG TPA: hypothetical protein VKZ63_12290, partial [Kofleriaceae bacterium]|nr:hypothetical protein [Kofleriaceae bacterium]